MDFESLLKFAVENGASDLHIQAGSPAILRIKGQMRATDAPPLPNEEVLEILQKIAPAQHRENVASAAVQGLDFSYALPAVSRFRCSAYSTLGQLGLVMRVIKTAIPTLKELNLPDVIEEIAQARRGLTLVTGTTGSGKSTTLAAMIDLINTSYRTKIITVEDPVEYVHTNKKALISQLQLGADTPSFDQALRQALRQDPDVILIGELRDVETLRIALRAADTGHQVFGTVHSSNAPQTVERIIAMFPPVEHKLMLSQLAKSVEAIISQRLVVTNEGQRRPAVEILRGGPVTEKFIGEGRVSELPAYVETREGGMQSFDQHLLDMYNAGIIRGTEALQWSTKPEALAMALRGIKSVGAGRAGT